MAGTLHSITKTLMVYKKLLGGGMNSLNEAKSKHTGARHFMTTKQKHGLVL